MASFCNGIIECYAGPQELGAPDDLENIIVGFIDDANKYLDIAVQEIDSEPIAQAILNACWRGVTVRIIMEQDYLLREDLYKVKKKDGETDAEARLRTQWEEYRRPKTI